MLARPTVKAEDIRLHETYEYEGVWLPEDVLRSTMEDIKTFHVREDDVFVVTSPKSGTNWVQEIISAVLHDGDIELLNKTHVWHRSPFLEMTLGGTVHENLPKNHKMLSELPTSFPRLIKSHLPGQLLPPQVWEKNVKIAYIIRDPRDSVVSLFHHIEMNSPHKKLSFDCVFNAFVNGTSAYGSWWDHYIYFWKRKSQENILFLRFEDMKKDLRGTVQQVVGFLGKSFPDDVIDDITNHCTFENMKRNPMTNPDTLMKSRFGGEMPQGKSFMRSGKVGGWRSWLSESQQKVLDKQIEVKLAGTGIVFD